MPDITMCSGKDCPLKDDCYRHTAKADSLWQSWFAEVPVFIGKDGTASCEYFLKR